MTSTEHLEKEFEKANTIQTLHFCIFVTFRNRHRPTLIFFMFTSDIKFYYKSAPLENLNTKLL